MGSGPLGLPGQPGPMGSREFIGGSVPNLLTFAFENVQPPSTLYVQRDDLLVLTGTSQIASGDTLTITARLLLPTAVTPGQPVANGSPAQSNVLAVGTGYIQTIQQTLAMPAQGTQYTRTISLAEGYLLSVAITSANATLFGQTYAGAYIGRGSANSATPIPSLVLIADYPTNVIPVGWPGVPIRQTSDAQGVISSSFLGTLALGATWTYTVPANTRAQLQGFTGTITNSAAVSSRNLLLQYLDAAGRVMTQVDGGVTQAASTIYMYSGSVGTVYLNDIAVAQSVNMVLPNIVLGPGMQIFANVFNMQAGDRWSLINLLLQTWVQ